MVAKQHIDMKTANGPHCMGD
uniref:Uncharacterized protein n=1 Tax=Anguilla anguilla TaxID=7936 RepID=A0A0E9RY32_ANGAN